MRGFLTAENINKSNLLTKKYLNRYVWKLSRSVLMVSAPIFLATTLYFLKADKLSLSSEIFWFLSAAVSFFLVGCSLIVLIPFRKVMTVNYSVCPACSKSIVDSYNWTCDHCHNEQGKIRSIYDKCLHCERELEKFVCEYCDKEFEI